MSAEEQLDVLSEDGKPTGQTKTKAEILRSGDWRRVVHIWVVDDEQQLLIQQRADKKGIFDNRWDVSVGGGVRAGEASVVAAQRELAEELGLDLPSDQFQLLGTWKVQPKLVPGKGVMKDFSDTFLVRVPAISDLALTLQPDEVQATDVIKLTDLVEKLKGPAFYAKWVQHGHAYYSEVTAKILQLYS